MTEVLAFLGRVTGGEGASSLAKTGTGVSGGGGNQLELFHGGGVAIPSVAPASETEGGTSSSLQVGVDLNSGF